MHRRLKQTRLIGERLETRAVLASNFTALDQYLLELINAARANPAAAASRYGVSDLNQGLPSGTITAAPKQPLSANDVLRQAGLGHAQDMLTRGYFDHVSPEGQGPGQRAAAVGYSYQLLGENLAWGNYGNIAASEAVNRLHAALIQSPGHRSTLFHPTFEELGVGIASGVKPGEFSPRYYIAEEFGANGGPRYLTGVVYADQVLADNFYTVGEGLANVTITVRSGGSVVATTTTSASGGYALELPGGTYQVTATGNGLLAEQFATVTIASQNVKTDFVRGAAPNLPYFIQEAFESLLGRTPGPADVQAWVLPASLTSLKAVLNAFVATDEYFAKGGTNAALVVNAYRDLLGRTPVQAEVNNWVASLAGGMTRGALAGAITTSAEFTARLETAGGLFRTVVAFTPDSEQVYAWTLALNKHGPWIDALYDELLARSPAASDRAAWSKALADGAPRELVADLFLRSPERLRVVVAGYYNDILGRTAADSEITGWAGALAGGMSPETVQSQFYAAAEFFAAAGGTNQGFVAALYQKVLGRTPSAGEASGWVQALAAGTLTRQGAAMGFLTSAEYRARLIDGWYQRYLNRPADPAGVNFWSGYLATGNTQHQALIYILTSPEFRSLAATRV